MCWKKYTRESTSWNNHPFPLEKGKGKGKASGNFGFTRFECGFLHWLDFFSLSHLLTQETKGLVEKGPENGTKVEQFFTLKYIEMKKEKSRIF